MCLTDSIQRRKLKEARFIVDRKTYLKKVREEQAKAESLATQFLLWCEQQGISEYAISCLPDAMEREVNAQQAKKGINTPFHFAMF